jgi:tripartite-type tricarboxylate transporter receptor subunit TctC
MSKRSTFNLRRGLLAAGLALPFAAPGRVLAQGTYPDKPLKLVIPFAAGGAIDVLGRTFASRLSEELKQQIVVDNRAGATGHVGSEYVARSPADGYTLLFTPSSTQVVSPHVLNLRYKPMEDLVPVTLAATVPNLVVVNAALPATTLQEFIDYARARPGQLSYASWGIGSNLHLATELLSLQSGLKMVHVPYSAPTLVQDLVAGRVQFHIGNIVELESFIRTGQVRLLAVTGPERLPAFPNAPTVAE